MTKEDPGLTGGRESDPLVQDVVDELHLIVDQAQLPEALLTPIAMALQAPGKLLASPRGHRWPALVLDCCAAAGGERRRAVPAAVAAELLILALDLLDEIEDDDPSPMRDRFGVAQTINCSTALLGLAGMALNRLLTRSVPTDAVVRCHAILSGAVATAAGGQHLDLSSEDGPALTQEQIEDVAARKSGTLVGGCCELGAAVAGAEAPLLQLYNDYGRHVGIAAQLDNDMHGLWQSVADPGIAGKSDVRRAKQTVPLAFLRDTDTAAGPLVETLWSSGALPYAWARVQVHREEAHALLQQIDGRSSVPPGMALSLLKHLTWSEQAAPRGSPDTTAEEAL